MSIFAKYISKWIFKRKVSRCPCAWCLPPSCSARTAHKPVYRTDVLQGSSCVCVILLSMALHCLICQKNQYDWIELYREQSQNNFSNVFFGGHTTGFARINIRKVLSLECLGSVNTFSNGFTVITCKPQILIRTLYTICTSTSTNTHTEGDTGFLLFFPLGLACYYPATLRSAVQREFHSSRKPGFSWRERTDCWVLAQPSIKVFFK